MQVKALSYKEEANVENDQETLLSSLDKSCFKKGLRQSGNFLWLEKSSIHHLYPLIPIQGHGGLLEYISALFG